ncbi:MAG: hypothetical protein GY822_22135 [Deltaproteobacteria bacterium]|nr:hypothetical protein [Deltaproteobacteria bacterium]
MNHPNVVSILEDGVWKGIYFIVMEHVRGDSVSKLQRDSSRRKMGIPSVGPPSPRGERCVSSRTLAFWGEATFGGAESSQGSSGAGAKCGVGRGCCFDFGDALARGKLVG